ncbi:hypothetical protein TcasGA2_TC033782 [Tribolium castaneum]|uniref:Uncharacterized protein n=2 Tax=Tribolium castaneum TaxID=7070 RepID=A0A139WEP6_TRICA|nr:hypothetical protein TcasGA2_TC033782 [Tribolium castaneum]
MVAESFVIYIVAVVLILIVLAVLIVTCFRQKDLQNNTTIEEATRHRRYINRGGQIVLSEFSRILILDTIHKFKDIFIGLLLLNPIMGDNGETAVAVIAVFGFCISFMAICCKALYRSKKAGTRDRARRAALAERHRRIVLALNNRLQMFDVSFPTVLFLIFIVSLFILYVFLQWRVATNDRKSYRLVFQNDTNQQEDVYNISSRVQGQEQGQWPTHDNHVSLEHFTINETNKYNDDPPTYEEAMRIAAANNNNTAVAAVPKTTVTPTSTSTSTANQQ